MPRSPTAVREVLVAILKTSRQAPTQEAIAGIIERLDKEPGLAMTDADMAALAKAESWRLEEAKSVVSFGRKKFPHVDFGDITVILSRLEDMRKSDPLSVDVLLAETMARYWARIEDLKLATPLSRRISELTAEVGKDIATLKRDAHRALGDSAALLKNDELKPDPVEVDAVQDLADAALAAAQRWHDELAGLRKALEKDPAQVSDTMITSALDAASDDRAPHEAALKQRLQALTSANDRLRRVQLLRLDATDESRLSNRFRAETSKRPKVTKKMAEAYVGELGLKPADKWANVLDYLQELQAAGDNPTAKAKASRQKPSVALANFLQLDQPGAWASHGEFLREHANDFDGQLGKAADLLRALAAINSAQREVNQWLVRLARNGTPPATLARYHAARADLAGASVPSAYSGRLDELMADAGFDATVWTRLKGWAPTKNLLLSAVIAYLKTGDEAIARRVAEDYGLVAGTRPGNTEEGRIATGLTAQVIEQSKQRTVHTTATGSGHAYKYHYIGGFVRAAWELHVHEGSPNLHPAWKTTSNPHEQVEGRKTYVLNGALRSLLS